MILFININLKISDKCLKYIYNNREISINQCDLNLLHVLLD